jgi:hypothetical protein
MTGAGMALRLWVLPDITFVYKNLRWYILGVEHLHSVYQKVRDSQSMTLFEGSELTMTCLFFSVIEIACTAFIVWYAWASRQPEATSEGVRRWLHVWVTT